MKARLIFSFLVLPAMLVAQYFTTPAAATLPIFLGVATAFLVWLWAGAWPKAHVDRDDIVFQHGLAGIGSAVVVVAVTMTVQSIYAYEQSGNWLTEKIITENKWVADNLANGRLSFYVSAVAFGLILFWNGYRCQIPKLAIWQYLIYGGALLALSYGYSFAHHIVYLGLLSWSIFFIVGDWAIIEHFVIKNGARLTYPQFLRIIVLNTVILFAFSTVWMQMLASNVAVYKYFVNACLLGLTVFLWIIAIVKLYPMTQRARPCPADLA